MLFIFGRAINDNIGKFLHIISQRTGMMRPHAANMYLNSHVTILLPILEVQKFRVTHGSNPTSLDGVAHNSIYQCFPIYIKYSPILYLL